MYFDWEIAHTSDILDISLFNSFANQTAPFIVSRDELLLFRLHTFIGLFFCLMLRTAHLALRFFRHSSSFCWRHDSVGIILALTRWSDNAVVCISLF